MPRGRVDSAIGKTGEVEYRLGRERRRIRIRERKECY